MLAYFRRPGTTMSDPIRHTPRLCFGEVRHTRLRPAANAFCHGVYFIRLPLRSLGDTPFGGRFFSRNRFNLLSFHDADHGDGRQPLVAWLDALLCGAGIHDADGEIWLQTFPRVLGYVFNPVAFWFCHRRDGALRAIVCEVSNTFGERHCYLLDHGAPMPFGIELRVSKNFHVSPFCRVDGYYRFRFMHRADREPACAERVVARIDYDDSHGPLLRTSVSGSAVPMSDTAVLQAFFRYPLMTFAVIARIHWQALRLWARRIPWFSKPAPPPAQVSRSS